MAIVTRSRGHLTGHLKLKPLFVQRSAHTLHARYARRAAGPTKPTFGVEYLPTGGNWPTERTLRSIFRIKSGGSHIETAILRTSSLQGCDNGVDM